MFTAFIQGTEGHFQVRELYNTCISQDDKGIGYLAHAVAHVNTGVTAEDLHRNGRPSRRVGLRADRRIGREQGRCSSGGYKWDSRGSGNLRRGRAGGSTASNRRCSKDGWRICGGQERGGRIEGSRLNYPAVTGCHEKQRKHQ